MNDEESTIKDVQATSLNQSELIPASNSTIDTSGKDATIKQCEEISAFAGVS